MKTQSQETAARELAQNQNRVLEFRQVKNTARGYKQAQAEIRQITHLLPWREPKPVAVRNIADHHVIGIDEKTGTPDKILPGMIGAIYDCQLAAMRRYLEPVNTEPEVEAEAAPVGRPGPVSTKKLKELLAELAKGDKGAAELQRMATSAREDMALTAASNIPLEAAKKKINEANMTLDFVAAREQKIQEPADLQLAQLRAELFLQVSQWNGIIATLRQGIEESIIKINTDFFNGDERACRRMFDGGIMVSLPVFTIFREAIYDDMGLRKLEGSQLTARAKLFMRHVERSCAVMKIAPEMLG